LSRDKNLQARFLEIFARRDPACARAFSRRSAILKIVEEKALGTRLIGAKHVSRARPLKLAVKQKIDKLKEKENRNQES